MEPGVYTVFCRKDKAKQRCTLLRSARVKRLLYSVRPVLVPLKPIGQLYGEVGAFADLPCGVIVLMGQTHSFECLEEPVQILRQELPAKETGSIPNKLILGNRVVHRALARRIQLEIILTSVCRKVTVGGKLDRTAGEGVFRPDLWVRGPADTACQSLLYFRAKAVRLWEWASRWRRTSPPRRISSTKWIPLSTANSARSYSKDPPIRLCSPKMRSLP